MFRTGCRFLTINGIIFILIGLFLAFLNDTPPFGIFQRLLNPVFNDFRTFSDDARRFRNLAWTFIGMFHVIWGIFIVFTVRFSLHKKETWAWISICLSVLTWISVDLYFSLSTKMYPISFNPMTAFFVLIFIIPLLMTIEVFKKR